MARCDGSGALGLGDDLIETLTGTLDDLLNTVEGTLDATGDTAVGIVNDALQLITDQGLTSATDILSAVDDVLDRINLSLAISLALTANALHLGQEDVALSVSLAAVNLVDTLAYLQSLLGSILGGVASLLNLSEHQIQAAFAQLMSVLTQAEEHLETITAKIALEGVANGTISVDVSLNDESNN